MLYDVRLIKRTGNALWGVFIQSM